MESSVRRKPRPKEGNVIPRRTQGINVMVRFTQYKLIKYTKKNTMMS